MSACSPGTAGRSIKVTLDEILGAAGTATGSSWSSSLFAALKNNPPAVKSTKMIADGGTV